MQRETLGQALILGLAILAIVLGLLATGGPKQGRAERRDDQRARDLSVLIGLVPCLAQEQGGALPPALAPHAACSPAELPVDPVSGAAYTYERLSEASYRICARFERPDEIESAHYGLSRIDAATGCAIGHYTP